MRKFILAFSALFGSVSAFSQDFSNKGKDFWLVFPAHVPSSGQAQMGLFITSDKNSSGTISVNGYNTTFTVTANQITGPIDIPYSNANVTAGESGSVVNKGIHVKTNPGQPAVVVYAHIYAGFRSEASLILPTNVLGKKYYSMNFWNAPTGASKSQFQIVAAEANTTVQIQIVKNGANSGTPFTVSMPNQGDVYQYQPPENNVDITGSYIESIAGPSGECKKIAVFSGSSALSISRNGCTGGSFDPLYQECYPISTWGKQFGIIPLQNNSNGYHLRVMAAEDNTNVDFNGTTVILNKGQYFPATTANPVPYTGAKVISADKPISVAQYLMSANCAGSASIGGQAQGDPDMVLLNPVEQNINDINIFSSNLQNIRTKYLCVYMKTVAAPSFRINNAAPIATFTQMPQNNGYSYLVEELTSYPTQSFRLKADSAFNAFTYGMGDAESYAYSAGTNVKDLYQQIGIVSQYGIEQTPSACTGSPFKFKISLPYRPDSLFWDLSLCSNYTPAGNVWQTGPQVAGHLQEDSTSIVNTKTIYWYSLPATYTFNTVGLYPVSITAYTANADGCGNTQDIDFDLDVSAPPIAGFSYTSNGCVTDTVRFLDTTFTVKPTYRWWWDFGEPASGANNNSTIKNPKHKYATAGTYNVRFMTITTAGCLSDTITKQITVTDVPSAKFGMSSPICEGVPVTFSDSSLAYAPGVLAKWIWDFGNGTGKVTRTINTDTTVTYSPWSPSITDTLWVETNSGCRSLPFTKTFKVNSKPASNFTLPAGICLPNGNAIFPITSTNADPAVQVFSYSWDYGDPASGVNNTGTSSPGTHFYAPPITTPYNVQLITTTSAGCSDTITKQLINVFAQEHAAFTTNAADCQGTPVNFTDISVLNPGVSATAYWWDWDDGSITTVATLSTTHTYALPGTYVVKHWLVTDKPCQSDTVTQTVTIYPIPAISSVSKTDPTTCLGNEGTIILNGLTAGQSYTVNFSKDGTPQAAQTITANASGQVIITGLSAGVYSNINVTANGCTSANATIQTLTDPPLPNAPVPGSNSPICSGNSLNLTATTVAGASGYNWTGPAGFTSTQQNPSILGATAAASGLYTVTVTVNNCTSLASVPLNVVVNQTPAISSVTNTNPTNCAGSDGTITLNGLTAGQSYTVNYEKNAVAQAPLNLVANASGQIIITGLTAGTYSNINVTANACTSANAATQILSDPNPPAPPATASNSPVCAGSPLNLTASAVTGGTYSWTGPNGFTSALQNPTIASPTTAASGNYLVTVTVNNCTSNTSIPLNVLVNITPAISSATKTDPTTCLGNEGTITLNGLTAGQSYTVNFNKNGVPQTAQIIAANAGGQVVITGLTAGTYSNINVSANGCTSANAATQTLSDPPLPTAPTPNSNGPICEGSTLNLTASTVIGASGYNWTGPNGFTSTLQNPSIASATAAASGIYTVTVTVNNCTSLASVPLNVVVNVMPAISSTNAVNPSTCGGSNGSITLNGLLAGQSYTVNFDKNGVAQTPLNVTANASGQIILSGLTAGTYSNITCTANACTSAPAPAVILSDPSAPAPPTAGSNSPLCTGATINLTAGFVNNATYTWSGPSGFTSSLQNPGISSAVVAMSGNYSVTVTVANCVSAATIVPVTVHPLPTADFNFTAPSCQTRAITFNDVSVPNVGTINTWSWNFGDPGSGAANTSTLQNPTHTFTNTGTYTVSLTVTNSQGCVSTVITKNVTITARPQAGFIIPEVCLSDTYAQFTDTSKIAAGENITGWLWNFGDPGSGAANTSGLQNPQHSYTAVGNYNVQLIAISANGCRDTLTQVLTVNGSFPVADFVVNNAASLCANDSVAIVNNSTVFPGTITKVEIYWDNVNFPAVFEIDNNPTPGKIYKHLYPNFQNPLIRNFTIRFRAYSGGICVSDKITVINVNAAPKVQFNNMPNACLDAAPFQITQATEIGGVPGTGVFSGPGVTAGGIFNPASVGPGTYLIKYTYTSTAGGCVDTLSKPITVLQPPVADFSFSALNCENVAITFTDNSNTPAGTLTTWTWNFGDGTGNIVRNNNSPFTHTYVTWGNYTVTLRVTTSDGCISTVKTLPITVNPTPRPNFTFPSSVCLPNAVIQFNNTSTIADGTENAFTYLWNFGDASATSVTKNPAHTYAAAGPFNVNLQVTSGAGCVHDTTIVLNVIHPQPKADFTINKPSVCIGQDVSFTDLSTGADGTVAQWNWNFGDNLTSNIQNPTHLYGSANTFNVSLYIVNSIGCNSDTVSKQFSVYPYPVVDAGPDRVVLEGGSIVLQPVVTGNNLQYLWTPNLYMNDNRSGTPTVSNILNDITYTLVVTAQGGCSASDKVFVKLLKAPRIPNTFTPNNDGINDTWIIEYLNTYPSCLVQVFTRTGQLVFESRGYTKPWDGTKAGNSLPFDTYYYIIEPGNGRKPMTGYVTIVK